MKSFIDYEDVAKALDITGKSIIKLYEFSGFSKQSASNYKSIGEIPIKYASEIAKFFNISTDDVIGGSISEKVSKLLLINRHARTATPIKNKLGINKYSTRISNVKETYLHIMAVKASAGAGTELMGLDNNFDTGETALIDNRFFKTPPPKNLRCIQVDGDSMSPMLRSDSWVLYKDVDGFESDGLYIINYDNTLMVKMLQVNPELKKIDIISTNKEYRSYSIDKNDQTTFVIIGRVLRSIV